MVTAWVVARDLRQGQAATNLRIESLAERSIDIEQAVDSIKAGEWVNRGGRIGLKRRVTPQSSPPPNGPSPADKSHHQKPYPDGL